MAVAEARLTTMILLVARSLPVLTVTKNTVNTSATPTCQRRVHVFVLIFELALKSRKKRGKGDFRFGKKAGQTGLLVSRMRPPNLLVVILQDDSPFRAMITA